jgi:hypothetical protein
MSCKKPCILQGYFAGNVAGDKRAWAWDGAGGDKTLWALSLRFKVSLERLGATAAIGGELGAGAAEVEVVLQNPPCVLQPQAGSECGVAKA